MSVQGFEWEASKQEKKKTSQIVLTPAFYLVSFSFVSMLHYLQRQQRNLPSYMMAHLLAGAVAEKRIYVLIPNKTATNIILNMLYKINQSPARKTPKLVSVFLPLTLPLKNLHNLKAKLFFFLYLSQPNKFSDTFSP